MDDASRLRAEQSAAELVLAMTEKPYAVLSVTPQRVPFSTVPYLLRVEIDIPGRERRVWAQQTIMDVDDMVRSLDSVVDYWSGQ